MKLYIVGLHVQRNRWMVCDGYDLSTPVAAEAGEVRFNQGRLVLNSNIPQNPATGGVLEVYAGGFVIDDDVLTFVQ